MDEFSFPWVTEFWWIFTVFVVALLVFHVVLLGLRPLSSVRWKQVDYVWLVMALVGMLGSVAASREMVATNYLNLAKHRLDFSYRMIESRLEFGASEAMCRQFVRSEFSPPPDEFERLQKEYDAQCAFFKNALSLMKAQPANGGRLDLHNLLGPYPKGGDQQAYAGTLDAAALYNSNVRVVTDLQQKLDASEFEMIMRLLGPLLISLALALRMTKVSAEVAAERKKHSSN